MRCDCRCTAAVVVLLAWLGCKAADDSGQLMTQLTLQSTATDKAIYRMLNHLRQYSGEILLDTICLYNTCLQNLTSLVRANADAAQPYLDKFLEAGNPKFLEIEHSDFKLRVLMRWNEDSLATYHSLCVRAYNNWIDLMFLHHNFTKFI